MLKKYLVIKDTKLVGFLLKSSIEVMGRIKVYVQYFLVYIRSDHYISK